MKLLRVIQDGEIEKIGRSGEKTKVDVRVIAATNKVLQQEIHAGRFREDLYYRLNVVPITIQQLCVRPDDVPILWEHFMHQGSMDMGKRMPVTEESAFAILKKYQWPGNVRELQNMIERNMISGFCSEMKILLHRK